MATLTMTTPVTHAHSYHRYPAFRLLYEWAEKFRPSGWKASMYIVECGLDRNVVLQMDHDAGLSWRHEIELYRLLDTDYILGGQNVIADVKDAMMRIVNAANTLGVETAAQVLQRQREAIDRAEAEAFRRIPFPVKQTPPVNKMQSTRRIDLDDVDA